MAGQQREKIEGTRGRLLGYKNGGMGDYSLYIHSTNLRDGAACEGRGCHILGLVLENSENIKNSKNKLDQRFWNKKNILQLFFIISHFSYMYLVFYYDLIIMIEYNILHLVGGFQGSLPLAYKLRCTKYADELKIEKRKYLYMYFL